MQIYRLGMAASRKFGISLNVKKGIMMKEILAISGNKNNQKILLVISGVLSLFFLAFLFYEFSGWMFFLCLIELGMFIYVNYFYSKMYDLRIENDTITIENIWRKENHELSDLLDIRQFEFIFPYPFNPFLKFIFKNKKEIICQLQTATKINLTKGGMDFYVANLKKEFIS